MSAATCTGYANCHCPGCEPDIDALLVLDTCPQCGQMKDERAPICELCHRHNVVESARVERAMKVAAFGKGRC